MNLLDRAVKMAAEQDEPEEMNFVRKHAREQVRQLTGRLESLLPYHQITYVISRC